MVRYELTHRQTDRQTDSDFNTGAIRMRTHLKIENVLLAKKRVKNLTSEKKKVKLLFPSYL